MRRRADNRSAGTDEGDAPVTVVEVGSGAYWSEAEPGPAPEPEIGAPLPGWAVLLVLGVAAAAAAGATAYWQHRARTVTTTRVVVPAAVASLDATGCPVGRDCLLDSVPDPRLTAAVQRQTFDAAVLTGEATTDPTGRHVYRTSLVARTRSGITLTLVAACVPQGDPVTGGSSVSSNSGSAVGAGAAVVELVVGGAPGCSVAVTAQVPAGVAIPDAGLTALAHDPAAQLAP